MDEASARLGQRLGNYILREVIGRGGMGVVYRAEHAYIGKQFAIKVLYRQQFEQPGARERFLREARTASRVDHPNIVGVTDFGETEDGTIFLVMDHVIGVPLMRVLQSEGRLPLFRALVILSQISRAVGAAHEKGIIHHDLKPENVMLEGRQGRRELVREIVDEHGTLELIEPEGLYDHVTVLDFGAAKLFADPSTQGGSSVVIGTPMYMAPETARSGRADRRSDIYALGVMMFEMLTGEVPFDGSDAVEIMMKQVEAQPPRPRDVCPAAEITSEAERVIHKALEKDPTHRHQTMEEFQADLQRCWGQVRFRRSLHVLPPPPSRPAPLPLTQKKGDVPSAAPISRSTAAVTTPGPLLLTKRKSGRHPTLPFGADTPNPSTQPTRRGGK